MLYTVPQKTSINLWIFVERKIASINGQSFWALKKACGTCGLRLAKMHSSSLLSRPAPPVSSQLPKMSWHHVGDMTYLDYAVHQEIKSKCDENDWFYYLDHYVVYYTVWSVCSIPAISSFCMPGHQMWGPLASADALFVAWYPGMPFPRCHPTGRAYRCCQRCSEETPVLQTASTVPKMTTPYKSPSSLRF